MKEQSLKPIKAHGETLWPHNVVARLLHVKPHTVKYTSKVLGIKPIHVSIRRFKYYTSDMVLEMDNRLRKKEINKQGKIKAIITNEKYRALVAWKYITGNTHKETASFFNENISTVSNALRKYKVCKDCEEIILKNSECKYCKIWRNQKSRYNSLLISKK